MSTTKLTEGNPSSSNSFLCGKGIQNAFYKTLVSVLTLPFAHVTIIEVEVFFIALKVFFILQLIALSLLAIYWGVQVIIKNIYMMVRCLCLMAFNWLST